MRFHVLTLFPQMIEQGLSESITGRALKQNIISLETVNIRDFANNKHNKVDDYTYGGGAGMLMQAEPVYQAVRSVAEGIVADHIMDRSHECGSDNRNNSNNSNNSNSDNSIDNNCDSSSNSKFTECDLQMHISEKMREHNARIVYVTPQGRVFDQQMAAEFAKCDDLVFLCGHYEGIDERVLDETVTDYVSIGDYVLTGGELPSMVMIDAISRLVPGVLHNDISAETESFHGNLLEYPQYSRPVEWHGRKVPDVLMSGNQKNIDKWRLEKSIERTKERRPDLYAEYERLDKCRDLLMKNKLLHMDMIELINRGHAEIIFEADGEYMLRDIVSKVCFHTNVKETKNAAGGKIQSDIIDAITNGIVLHQQEYVDMFKDIGFTETVECRQAVYTRKEKLSVSGLYRPDGKPMPNGLVIEKLDESYSDEAAPMYPGFDEPDYIRQRIAAGAVYGAFLPDEDGLVSKDSNTDIKSSGNVTENILGKVPENRILAGIIGIHEEGSIGMLYVKPEYRHQKIAKALETYAFNMVLENGWTPYGQVIVGNEPSMKLQEGMGLYFSKSSVYWMTK